MNRRTVGWFAASRACSVDTAIMRDASVAEPPVAAPALPGDELVAARPHAAYDTVRQMMTAARLTPRPARLWIRMFISAPLPDGEATARQRAPLR